MLGLQFVRHVESETRFLIGLSQKCDLTKSTDSFVLEGNISINASFAFTTVHVPLGLAFLIFGYKALYNSSSEKRFVPCFRCTSVAVGLEKCGNDSLFEP